MRRCTESVRRSEKALSIGGGRRERRPLSSLSRGQWGRLLHVESLEPRLVLSGEPVNLMLGTLPDGASVTTQYFVTVDEPFPKGDAVVQNQATSSGTGITNTVSAPADRAIDNPARVTDVFVKNSAWNATFLNGLATAGLGDASLGYRIPTGADQLKTLPWDGINTVSIKFSENVTTELLALSLTGVNPVTVNGFTPSGDVATWPLTTPLGANKIRAILDDIMASAGGQILDGEWIDGTATVSSGNGAAGGDFSYRFDVLPGDGNSDGVVNVTDLANMAIRVGSAPGAGNYSAYFDVNGDGAINVADLTAASGKLADSALNQLPAGIPGGTPGSGWVANAAPTTPRPPASAGTLGTTISAALVTDPDGDAVADPGDTLRYTIVITNASGATVSGVQLSNTIDPNTTLVAASVHTSPLLSNTVDTAALAYTENAAATAIVPNLVVADPDGTLASATVQITGNYAGAQDVLSFTNQLGITGSYNPADGKLTLTGSTTVANYQTALRSVTFHNTSDTPDTLQRTISVQANDGAATNNLSNIVCPASGDSNAHFQGRRSCRQTHRRCSCR
jgi:uncharacterized repeat protein (TIGR01451 family)